MNKPSDLQQTSAWAAQTFELRVPDSVSYEQLESLLAARLEILISEDFQQFIYLLYRIDVSEKKVTAIIQDATAAGVSPYPAIAALIIHRQLEKIATRASFKQPPPAGEDDEERW
ncbi:hypothetical protein [Chitinophaga sp. Cy-1792]|uniref:hypothetical protein n=1 Tax=Chitinophaga sp. Cy-1792 TaxID=2608339 RepID=UPI0014213CA7|nr:hypothetical protein [Chitinophaga sp. Cy-1792]NIG52659.1 hypothetical protein [Chitinophaga sp. Cy-1792]